MNRLFEIAKELGEIAHERFDLRVQIALEDKQIAKRQADLIPEGGWPGANADTRKANEKAAYAADDTLFELSNSREIAQVKLDELEVARQVLIDERDAWQWTIRDNEATAVLGFGRSVFDMMKIYKDANPV